MRLKKSGEKSIKTALLTVKRVSRALDQYRGEREFQNASDRLKIERHVRSSFRFVAEIETF